MDLLGLIQLRCYNKHMPGYLTIPPYNASGIPLTPTGDVSATNVQDGIAELSSEKATVSALNIVENNLLQQISSVEGVALLGL